MPRLVGATRSKGGRSQAKKASFSEGPEADCLMNFQKGEAGNLGGRPKPVRAGTGDGGAERGNYPEAKPNREGLKDRPACNKRELAELIEAAC